MKWKIDIGPINTWIYFNGIYFNPYDKKAILTDNNPL